MKKISRKTKGFDISLNNYFDQKLEFDQEEILSDIILLYLNKINKEKICSNLIKEIFKRF